MFHWFGTVTNTRGDSLPSWQVECVAVSDGVTVVPIFADESSTPIASISGVANRAVADENGNYDFFVPSGTYSLRFYSAQGVFQRTQRFLPMYGADNAEAAAASAQEASIAAASLGPLYATIADGLTGTVSGDEFAVDNANGTASIYLNNVGVELLRRIVIIDPANAGSAALIGTTAGTLQAVLDDFEARIAALEP